MALPVGVDVFRQEISPDGKWLLLTASAAGQQNLYRVLARRAARRAVGRAPADVDAGRQGSAQFTPDSKEVYYLDAAASNVTLEQREPKPITVTAELDVDFAREKLRVSPGVELSARQFLRREDERRRLEGRADDATSRASRASRTPDEMRRIMLMMVGELNASHMGIWRRRSARRRRSGGSVLDFDRGEYERAAGFNVTDVLPLGPAALAGLKPGDFIASGRRRSATAPSESRRAARYTIGKRIALSIAVGRPGRRVTSPSGRSTRRPSAACATASGSSSGAPTWRRPAADNSATSTCPTCRQARCAAVCRSRCRKPRPRRRRHRHSQQQRRLRERLRDRRVRATRLLQYDSARHADRAGAVRARPALLEKPTVLVTNQHSLSDAEDFTEGYRAMKLGKVVGEPTAGWIIYTWDARLIDGSVAAPAAHADLPIDGTPMEMHPRPVDVR